VFFIKDELNRMGYDSFDKKGLSIYTSLDLKTQKMAEEIVADEVEKAKKLHITNGAVVILDVKTGNILAMVGSKNYNATDIDGKLM
jgi:cell division protein FtsI/penicillin-binding protein 2